MWEALAWYSYPVGKGGVYIYCRRFRWRWLAVWMAKWKAYLYDVYEVGPAAIEYGIGVYWGVKKVDP